MPPCLRAFPRGFTLLEVIVVVAIVGLLSGLIAFAIAAQSPEKQRRRALESLVMRLSVTRIEALRTGRHQVLEASIEDGVLLARSLGEEDRSWRAPGLVVLSPSNESDASLEATFGPSGRTDQRSWLFSGESPDGRIWRIEFDPVSGQPALRRGQADE